MGVRTISRGKLNPQLLSTAIIHICPLASPSLAIIGMVMLAALATSQQLPDPFSRPPTFTDGTRIALASDPPPSAFASPDKARSLADRVVGAIDQLASIIASNRRTIDDVDSEISKARTRLAEIPQEKERALKEYGEGLFCSGCGQTRSQIQAKGEQFPHPGHTIVSATPAQIAAKAAEFEQLIAQITQRLSELRSRRDNLVSETTGAVSEVRSGLLLWQAAMNFERDLRAQQELDAQDEAKREILVAEEQAKAAASAQGGRSSQVWEKLRTELQAKDAARTARYWQQVQDSGAHADSSYVKLCSHITHIQDAADHLAGPLSMLPRLQVKTDRFSFIVSPAEIGARFRFGRLGSAGVQARFDQDSMTLEVQAFYDAYRARAGVFSRLDMTRLGPRHSFGPVLGDNLPPPVPPARTKSSSQERQRP